MNSSALLAQQPRLDSDRRAELSVILWVFMAVATALFFLFLAAYVMRMTGADWSAIKLPWQLNISTLLLMSASLALHLASQAASAKHPQNSRQFMLLAGLCGLGFLISQWLVWQTLMSMQVALAGNPSASFFYLLTAMHGLHVLGGFVIYALTLGHGGLASEGHLSSWKITLCARYWHFLLAIWLLLFVVLNWLTPELVQIICGT